MADSAPKLRYTDEDFLRLVSDERKRSIGFGDGDSGELSKAREKALDYYRGEMADVPSLPNRSKAVSTDVAEAIETVLPDLMEVFFGGDDVVTFLPEGEEDEEAAQEETDAVSYVVFTENDAFLTFYTAIKDALQTRTGLFHWWKEDLKKKDTREDLAPEAAGVFLMELAQAKPWAQPEIEEREDGTVAVTIEEMRCKICVKAFPPEDFTVAEDTVALRDTTYCAIRDRPRVQDLIARGIDPEVARSLPAYGQRDDEVAQARDEAGENDQPQTGGLDDLRKVETRAHYIRLDADDDGDLEIWRVVTDAEERHLLEKEEVDHIPFGAITPYIVAHRFYGVSVADLMLEIQRIKTALLRMELDSGYFALNQRNEVAMSDANEWTLVDLIRNEPNVPVRSKTGNAIKPITAGGLNFDVLAALEYVSTMGEQRSGIVRNAQGLNPDTLHDTAKGAMALISAAQKRVRMIARVFAETGVKDMFLGVHQLMRTGYGKDHAPASMKLRKKWKTVKPGEWGERQSMTVHVGVGSAGREYDLMVAGQGLEIAEKLITLQGGANGPIVTLNNIHNWLKKWSQAAKINSPELYWSDPAEAKPVEPKPDPEMEKAQAELQLKAQEGQANLQLKAQEGQVRAQLDEQKDVRAHEREMLRLQTEGEIKRYQVDQELQLKRETTVAELQMKRELLMAELQMKREVAVLNAEVARETGLAKAEASTGVSDVQTGGDPG